MLFGLSAPVPHVTVGSDLIRSASECAMSGLPDTVVPTFSEMDRSATMSSSRSVAAELCV
jgi:hypothetical protein